MKKPLFLSSDVIKAISHHPLPNFHKAWQEYARSDFRREWLKAWAGDDPEKQRVVQKLLDESTPM